MTDTYSFRVMCTTTDGNGTRSRPHHIFYNSPVGRLFDDPTVQSVTITRTADGAILKGDSSRTYERLPQ